MAKLVELTQSQLALIAILQHSYGVLVVLMNEGKPLVDALKYLRDEIQKEIILIEQQKVTH